MQSNSTYFRSYGLRYSSSTGESLLDAIVQYDKDNNQYNGTTISWESPSFNTTPSTVTRNILSGDGYQITSQIGLTFTQSEFPPKVLAVKMNRCFGYV